MDDAISIYEPLDLMLPTIPPRSRLFHLEPIGLGTPYVESLTSYINRLARLHFVQLRKLITQEVLPLLRISSSSKADIDPKESQSIATLNGITPQVGEWVRALAQLTLREGLQFLSMLTWSNIADQKGVVRSIRAWCPVCYDEWQRTSRYFGM